MCVAYKQILGIHIDLMNCPNESGSHNHTHIVNQPMSLTNQPTLLIIVNDYLDGKGRLAHGSLSMHIC